MFLLTEEVTYRAKIVCLPYLAKYMFEYSTGVCSYVGLSCASAV